MDRQYIYFGVIACSCLCLGYSLWRYVLTDEEAAAAAITTESMASAANGPAPFATGGEYASSQTSGSSAASEGADRQPGALAQPRSMAQLRSASDDQVAHVRASLRQARTVEERCRAMEMLGEMRDPQSAELLFAALDDPDIVVRGRAGAALQKIMGLDVMYRAGDPPAQRAEAISRMKAYWDHQKHLRRDQR